MFEALKLIFFKCDYFLALAFKCIQFNVTDITIHNNLPIQSNANQYLIIVSFSLENRKFYHH